MSLPPSEIPQGAIRFNTDSQKLEFYAQGEWWVMSTDTPNLGRGADTTAGARGLFGGGSAPAIQGYTDIEYINISSTGNAIDFGDLLYARRDLGACASSTRGVFAGGAPVSTPLGYGAKVDYVTISSTGTAVDFGASLTFGRRAVCGCGNQTRGLFAGGWNDASPSIFYHIDYITIASTGDVVDFGDFGTADTSSGVSSRGCVSSPTRAVFGGGETPTQLNNMDFVTISTLGDSQDFGDLSEIVRHIDGCSNSVRGLFGGGATPVQRNTIEFITIASTGNTINFGDLIKSGNNRATCSSPTRGVWAGGYVPTVDRTIEYVILNTEGNAVDFGDLTGSNSGDKAQLAGLSNAHGGL